MMENKKILVILSLVVIASGCSHTASTTSTSSSDSVTVQNFSAFPQDVYNDQQVRLTLTLINDGDATAENVVARLFNVPFAGESDSNNNVWKLQGDRSISFGTLEAADEENNLPARESNQYWTLTSPSLSNGVTIPYQFLARVYYKYQTRGTTSITLMDQDRFREEGQVSRPTLDNTAGPVQMEIRTQSPIVFYPEDEGNRQTEMCVVVKNEGSGTPFIHSEGYSGGSYDVEESNSNKVRLRIPDQGNIQFTPSDGSGNTAVVELFGNRGISCFNINVEGWDEGVGPQQEVPVVLEADYGYYKETDTSVTVRGSERFSGGSDSGDDTDTSDTDSTDDSESASEDPGPS